MVGLENMISVLWNLYGFAPDPVQVSSTATTQTFTWRVSLAAPGNSGYAPLGANTFQAKLCHEQIGLEDGDAFDGERLGSAHERGKEDGIWPPPAIRLR